MYDSHCHLSPRVTQCIFDNVVTPNLEASAIEMNIMATNHIDYYMICDILSNPNVKSNVRCSIGIHPWWSHLYSFDKLLLDNVSGLSEIELKRKHYEKVLESTKFSTEEEFNKLIEILPVPFSIYEWEKMFAGLLATYNSYKLNIGEIGLDKLFRVPDCGFLGLGDSNSKLSTYKVKLDHQAKLFGLQMELALRFNRWVSVHNVKCAGRIVEVVKRYPKLLVVLHSYTGSIDSARELRKSGNVWFGISQVINLNSESELNNRTKALIESMDDRILLETDLGVDCMKPEEHWNKLQFLSSIVSDVYSKVHVNWEKFLEKVCQ